MKRAAYIVSFLLSLPLYIEAAVDPVMMELGIGVEVLPEGLSISAVADKSVAWYVGLRVGDIIVSVDDQSVRDETALVALLKEKSWTEPAHFKVLRDSEMLLFTPAVLGTQRDRPRVSAGYSKGSVIYFSLPLVRGVTSGDIDLRRKGGVPIPYARLNKDNTSYWTYTLPACQRVGVKRVWKDGSVSVVDGIFRYRLRGSWDRYAHREEDSCLKASAEYTGDRLSGATTGTTYTYGAASGDLTFH